MSFPHRARAGVAKRGGCAYLGRMSYWRRISPRGALADLWHEWRAPNPYRWQILGLSVAATFTMMVVLIPESQRAEPRRPDVTFITTFAPDRTDAEIVASNIENQKRKEAREALAAERAARRKERARALARASGFDPDELERQYSDPPAAEPAAAARTPAPAQAPAAAPARTTSER